MRPVTLLQLSQIEDQAVKNALKELERASQDADIITLAQAITINGSFTTTRSINPSTATLTDVINVLCTFISDCQKGGATRTT